MRGSSARITILGIVTASIVMLTGCTSTTGTDPSLILPLPTPTISTSPPVVSPRPAPSVSTTMTRDGLPIPDENSSADDILAMYENRAAAPDVNPSAPPEDQQKAYQEFLDQQKGTAMYNETINGVGYKIVVVSGGKVGPEDPLRIGIIPSAGAKNSVKLTKPTVTTQNVIMSSASADGGVTCDKDTIYAQPVVITCTFSKSVPPNSQLWFGFVIDKENQRLLQIPLNS